MIHLETPFIVERHLGFSRRCKGIPFVYVLWLPGRIWSYRLKSRNFGGAAVKIASSKQFCPCLLCFALLYLLFCFVFVLFWERTYYKELATTLILKALSSYGVKWKAPKKEFILSPFYNLGLKRKKMAGLQPWLMTMMTQDLARFFRSSYLLKSIQSIGWTWKTSLSLQVLKYPCFFIFLNCNLSVKRYPIISRLVCEDKWV